MTGLNDGRTRRAVARGGRLSIAVLRELAERNNGEPLPAAVLAGKWCPRCGGPKRLTLGDMQAVASLLRRAAEA